MFTGSQSIAEVKGIRTASDTDLLSLILLDTDLPGPAPSQRTNPHVTMVLIVWSLLVDREPRIILLAGRSPTTLENCLPRLNQLLVECPLPCPSTREIPQAIIAAARQIPSTRSNLLHDERSGSFVLYLRGTSEYPGGCVSLIFQLDVNIPKYVLQQNGETVTLNRVRHILKSQIPIAVRKGNFQIGLHVKPTTPCHVVQPCCV